MHTQAHTGCATGMTVRKAFADFPFSEVPPVTGEGSLVLEEKVLHKVFFFASLYLCQHSFSSAL